MKNKIDTLCVHGGDHRFPDERGSLTFPLYQTAAFSHTKLGHNDHGFDYSRISNPTRQYLEETVAALEGAVDCVGFSTGMAAVSACFALLGCGDHVVCGADLYGGTVLYIDTIAKKNGLRFSYVDTTDLNTLEQAMGPDTKAIYIETPSNPMMNVTDIQGCAEIARKHGAVLMVDNTFLSPYFQNPIALGADLVIHSGTKYLGGHNDTLAGFVCCADPQTVLKLRTIATATGGNLAPFDAWLIQRGIKTLPIRMERQQETALRIAIWLKNHPKVTKVYYVGLPEHPGCEINRRQSRGSGGMLSFTVDSHETALKILKSVKVITFAESLGGPESLITFPRTQTHRDVSIEVQESLGITNSFLRLSVGLENAEDLIKDLEQAME